MGDREAPVIGEARIQACRGERIRPELARDVGQDARAVTLTVDRSGTMGEALEAADRLSVDFASGLAVLARDRDECAGVSFVVHG